jgi:hypothetical protein
MSIYTRNRLLNHVRKHTVADAAAEQLVRVLSYMTKFSLRGILKSMLSGRPSYTLMRFPDGTVSLEVIRKDGVDYKVAVDMYWAPHPILGYTYTLDKPDLVVLFRREHARRVSDISLKHVVYLGEGIDKGVATAIIQCKDQRAAPEIQEFGTGTAFVAFCREIELCAGSLRLSYYFGEYDDGSMEFHLVAHDHPDFHHWVRIIGNSAERPGFPSVTA